MKKKGMAAVVIIALLIVFSLGATACKRTPEPTPAPATVTLDATDVELDVYETFRLNATTRDTDETVTWSTSDAAVATVDGGLITALQEGKTTVTASAGGAQATCAVTVYNSYAAPVLEVDCERVAVAKDGTFTVQVKTLWKGKELGDDIAYAWTLGEDEDSEVAEIAANGKTATFTGKKYGEAVYYVSATVHDVALVKKVTVRVCNTDVTFAVSNLQLGVNAYTAKLGLVATDSDVNEITPDVKVYNKGVLVENANIVWTSDDAGVVTVDGSTGKMTAVAEGVTTVKGTYDDCDVVIDVETYRSVVKLADTVYFETSKFAPKANGAATTDGIDKTVRIDGTFVGTVSSVTVNGVNVMQSFDGNTLTLNGNMPADKADWGEVAFELHTEKAIYTADAMLVTQVIRTNDQFMKWHEVAKTLNEHQDIWDGYFVLGNDLDFKGATYQAYWHWFQDRQWADLGYGFKGIFDGRGHVVDNLRIATFGAWGSIFGQLTDTAEVKNIAFTNLVHGGKMAVIASGMNGKIENVYVHIKAIENGGDATYNTSVFTEFRNESMRIVNCFAVIDTSAGVTDYTYGIGSCNAGKKVTLENVYVVGETKGMTAGTVNAGGTYGAYADYNDLISDRVNFSAWDNDFWRVEGSVPYPRNVEVPAVSTQAEMPSAVAQGSTTEISVDKYAVVTLDESSSALGVTFKNGMLTVPSDVPAGAQIGLTVQSVFAPSNSQNYTVGVIFNRECKVETPLELYINELNADFEIDLTSVASDIEGQLAGVTVGGTPFASFRYANGKLSLDKAAIEKMYGDKQIVATFETKSGDVVTGYVTVKQDATLITMRIQTNDQFLKWHETAKTLNADPYMYDGYFVLGNDLDLNGAEYQAYWKWVSGHPYWSAYNKNVGFKGIFDGRGHVVDNLKIVGGASGSIFGQLAAGAEVKNIAFTNLVHGGQMAVIAGGQCGRIENVYVHVKQILDGGNAGNKTAIFTTVLSDGLKIVDCFAVIDTADNITEHTYGIGYQDRGAALDLTNVYVVGETKGSNQAKGTYGAYADFTGLIGAKIDSASWDSAYWSVVGGVPVFKTLKKTVSVADDVPAYVAAGADIQLHVDGQYVKYTLDDAAVTAKLTVDRFGKISVPASAAGGATYTVTVGSYADNSIQIVKSFTIIENNVHTLEGRQDVAYAGDGDTFTVDLSALTIDGTLSGVMLDTMAFADYALNGDMLTLKRETLKGHWGEKTIVASFEKKDGQNVSAYITVNIPVTVVTQVIKTNDQFMKWHEVAKTLNEHQDIWDGYFVLGNDLDFKGATYQAYWHWFQDRQWASLGYGFRGIFDGRGHVVDNLRIATFGAWGSIFGQLTDTAEVKNIAFTNLVHGGKMAVIASGMNGKIENVYVHIKAIENGGDATYNTSVFTEFRNESMRIVNCFAVIDTSAGVTDYTYGIGSCNAGKKVTLENVYVVGETKGMTAGTVNAGGTYGAYADFAGLIGAKIDSASWDSAYWSVVGGVPVFKTLKKTVSVADDVPAYVAAGANIQLHVDGQYVKYTLDDAAVTAGLTVDRFGKISVPASAAAGATYTVTVGSYADNSIGIVKSFTIVDNIDIEYYSAGEGADIAVDLSAYALSGTLKEVKLDETVIAGCTLNGNTLSIPKTVHDDRANWGEKTLTVTMNDDSSICIPVTVVTQVIKTNDRFRKWHEVAKTLNADPFMYDGYFVLDADLDFANEADYSVYWKWTADNKNWAGFNSAIGFKGIFDGRGHVIDKLKIVGGASGSIFGQLAVGAEVKNIAFTNLVHGGKMAVIACGQCGKIENVYVHVKQILDGGNTGDKTAIFTTVCSDKGLMKIVNCFAVIDTADNITANTYGIGFQSRSDGAGGALNLTNVYVVGETKGMNITPTGTYGAYADRAAMKAAGVNVNPFVNAFWTIDSDGLPIPRALATNS